jgi:hypothetical protein
LRSVYNRDICIGQQDVEFFLCHELVEIRAIHGKRELEPIGNVPSLTVGAINGKIIL